MREILFRGKRLDNFEWIYGSLIEDKYIVGNVVDWNEDYFNTEYWWRVILETVGQFTGLTDKNGKEIYEGDILKFEAESPYPFLIMDNGVVKYEPCKFYLTDDINEIGIHVDNWYELEVIGNIHDNPELLK